MEKDNLNQEASNTKDKTVDANDLENMDDVVDDESETAEDTDQTATGSEESKKRRFGKDKKSKEVIALEQKVEELNDRLIRNMAEFDNFRKRTEKEKSQMFEVGAKSIIEKILPVIDNFERGLSTITEDEKEGAFAQGIEKIYKQLTTTMAEVGVKPIDAVGKEFDPNLHNAVMHGEDDTLGENIVSDEFQKGYMYHDSVVRHSMVKVVN